jgi:hypothetical protein
MERVKSRIVLIAAVVALAVIRAAAQDDELQSAVNGWNANREDASEWLELRFRDELDRPKILWCHGKKKCSPRFGLDADPENAQPLFELKILYTQNEASAGVVAYYQSVLSEYKGVRTNGFHSSGDFDLTKNGSSMKLPASYGASNTFHYAELPPINLDIHQVPDEKLPVFTIKPPELTLSRPYQAMVVAAPQSRAAAPANPMDGLGPKPVCRDMAGFYYGKDGNALTGSQLVHRRLLPQEIEFAVAGLPGVDLNALGYPAAMAAGSDGRIGEVDSFVKNFRAVSRASAQSSGDGVQAQRFTAFEAGFLSCRTAHAGVRDAFFRSLQSLAPNQTAGFVARWRGFVRNELKIYSDGSADGKLPAGPVPYKDALDLINQRTVSFQGGASVASTTAPARRIGPANQEKPRTILDIMP